MGDNLEMRVSVPVVLVAEERPVPVAFLVLNHEPQPVEARIAFTCDGGHVEPDSLLVDVPLADGVWSPYRYRCPLNGMPLCCRRVVGKG
jgi:hypothetical protein